MSRFAGTRATTALAAVLAATLTTGCTSPSTSVAIDPSRTFQRIEGWGNGSGNLGGQLEANFVSLGAALRESGQLPGDRLSSWMTLGPSTGTRIWEIGTPTDGSGIDNGDCDVIDWAKFQPGTLMDMQARYMVYFKNRVEARGEHPSFYSSTGLASDASSVRPWVLHHPGERAQQIVSSALYWKMHYGIEMNYAVLANEPGSTGSPSTPAMLAEDIKALAPRLRHEGLQTKI